METESKVKTSYTTEMIVVAGYIVFFCILIGACLGFFYVNRALYLPKPPVLNEFAQALPPITPTPSISFEDEFEENSILFEEDFNNNQNHWLNSDDDTHERFSEGSLFFQSRYSDEYTIISCESCPYLKTPYYLEATLSTNVLTDEPYGVVFKRNSSFDDYYLFMINPESRKYYLFHRNPDEWSLRLSGESSLINSYPESTTLGIYANEDRLELYVDGKIVDSYVESGASFHPGFFGFYTNNDWFGVYVDNIAIYKIGE